MDDTPIEIAYQPPPRKHRTKWIPFGAAAAAAVLITPLALFVGVSTKTDKSTEADSFPTPTTEATVPLQPAATSTYRSAWLPYWDDGTGLETFKANATSFDEIHPFWYEVQGADKIITQGTPAYRQSVLQTARDAGVKVVPTLTETLRTDEFLRMLEPPESRALHVRTVCDLAKREDFAGIDIDYETFTLNVPADKVERSRSSFTTFVTELGACLHDAGKSLQVTLLPKTSDAIYAPYLSSLTPGVFDYKAIGAVADIVRPMAYDNATPLTASASTDPLPWVQAVGEYARLYIPANKLVLGIALYGYDWGAKGAKSTTARQAATLARQKNATVLYSDRVRSRFFEYATPDGTNHSVWFNSAADTHERVRLAEKLQLAGVSYWALGNESRDYWPLFR